MRSAHAIPFTIVALWASAVAAAVYCQEMSASAGRLPGPWTGYGMLAGFGLLALVVVAAWHIPEFVPRVVSRVILLIGMAGAFWSAGTLTRALYSVVG